VRDQVAEELLARRQGALRCPATSASENERDLAAVGGNATCDVREVLEADEPFACQ
jgi:hypothetical protein